MACLLQLMSGMRLLLTQTATQSCAGESGANAFAPSTTVFLASTSGEALDNLQQQVECQSN